MYLISNINRTMDIKPFPKPKTHILNTLEATAFIDWHDRYTKVLQYPLPTEMVVLPGQNIDIKINRGLIWPSKCDEFEFVGTSNSTSKNNYRVAQVYTDVGQDGHTLYALYGWLHITTDDLEYMFRYNNSMHVSLYNLYLNIEEGVPTN